MRTHTNMDRFNPFLHTEVDQFNPLALTNLYYLQQTSTQKERQKEEEEKVGTEGKRRLQTDTQSPTERKESVVRDRKKGGSKR